MRWQPVARRINDKLIETGGIEKTQFSDLVDFSSHADGAALFRAWYRIIASRGAGLGWNKEWQDTDLVGWYGTTTTIQSLDAVALEIESDELLCENLRRWLNSVFNPEKLTSPDNDFEKSKILLVQFGIDSESIEKSAPAKRLLQKLNLHQRERPVIERWHWSQSQGLGYLTNNGRITVSREMVWARAVECALSIHNKMTDNVRDFLEAVDSDERETFLDTDMQGEAFAVLVAKLKFYGLAERLSNCIRFKVKPGDFPKLALSLWR